MELVRETERREKAHARQCSIVRMNLKSGETMSDNTPREKKLAHCDLFDYRMSMSNFSNSATRFSYAANPKDAVGNA